jgi:hypothetical protein
MKAVISAAAALLIALFPALSTAATSAPPFPLLASCAGNGRRGMKLSIYRIGPKDGIVAAAWTRGPLGRIVYPVKLKRGPNWINVVPFDSAIRAFRIVDDPSTKAATTDYADDASEFGPEKLSCLLSENL